MGIAGIMVAAVALLGQQKVTCRVARLEQTLAEQRESYYSMAERLREDNGWFSLLMRAQESVWNGSGNAPVQARLVAESDVTRVSEPVRLLAEVRNASNQDQTVSGIFIQSFSIKLYHNGMEAKYVGPWPSMPPPSPVVLPAGRIMRATISLAPADYPELKQPGVFTAEWSYSSESHAPGITWAGILPPIKTVWRSR